MASLYYVDDYVRLWLGDWRDVEEWRTCSVLLTDPPYGIRYRSNHPGRLRRSIQGDHDTSERDEMLKAWGTGPALVFGTWKRQRPTGTRALLVWDTGGALGMGDVTLPWKPSHQEVYVLGSGFTGRRTSDVLRFPPVQSTARNGRVHPHEKPEEVCAALLEKCPPGSVADPFAGSGPVLRVAKNAGRHAIGVELEEEHCERAARRLQQEALSFT